jgi:O-antigen/teichoic acid export membrane protein
MAQVGSVANNESRYNNRLPSSRRRHLAALLAFAAVSVPKTAGGVLQLLVLLLLARQLPLEDLGVVSVCVSAILLGDAVLGAALDTAVIRLATAAGGAVSGMEIQKAGLAFKLAASLALLAVSLAGGERLSRTFFESARYSGLIVISAGALAAMLALRSAQTHFQIEGRFHLFGLADWANHVLKFGGIGLLLALHAATPARILLLYLLAPLAAAAVFLRFPRPAILRARLRPQAVRTLLGTAGWFLGAALAGTLTTRMDLMMVSAVGGAAEAGRFGPAQQLVAALPLIGGYLAILFAPKIMPLLDSGRFAVLYLRFQVIITLVAIAIYFIARAVLPTISAAFFPPALQDIDAIASVLLIAALAGLISFPWTVSLLLFLMPRRLMVLDLVALPLLFVAYRHSIQADGALGAAQVTAAYAILKLFILHGLAWLSIVRYPIQSTLDG